MNVAHADHDCLGLGADFGLDLGFRQLFRVSPLDEFMRRGRRLLGAVAVLRGGGHGPSERSFRGSCAPLLIQARLQRAESGRVERRAGLGPRAGRRSGAGWGPRVVAAVRPRGLETGDRPLAIGHGPAVEAELRARRLRLAPV